MSWVFNLRSRNPRDSDDSDDGDGNCDTSKLTEDAKLMKELDLSSRPDNATYKSDPWTIAKINAASRRNHAAPYGNAANISDDRAPASRVVSPQKRPPNILDAFKKQAERPPPKSGASGLKPADFAHTTCAPPLGRPAQSAFPPKRLNVASIPRTRAAVIKEATRMIDEPPLLDNSLTDPSRSVPASRTSRSAHILTDSAKANLQTFLPPGSRSAPFPDSFSSPIRPQPLVPAVSPPSHMLSVAHSSPARSYQANFLPGANEKRVTARHDTISARFPHVRRMNMQAFTQHALGSSKFKSPIASGYPFQFDQHQAHRTHAPASSMSPAFMGCKADILVAGPLIVGEDSTDPRSSPVPSGGCLESMVDAIPERHHTSQYSLHDLPPGLPRQTGQAQGVNNHRHNPPTRSRAVFQAASLHIPPEETEINSAHPFAPHLNLLNEIVPCDTSTRRKSVTASSTCPPPKHTPPHPSPMSPSRKRTKYVFLLHLTGWS